MVEVVTVDADDLRRFVRVHNTARPEDPTTVEDLVDWRQQAEDMVWLVAVAEGEDAGAGIGLVGWHSEPQTARAHAWVLPEARGRGAGTALYTELARWSSERGCAAVETKVAADDEASLAWVTRRGFREVGRESYLDLELDAVEPPAVDPPEGVEITTWAQRPGIERELYEVYMEAEPDIPGEEANEITPFEKWLANDMQGHSDRPEGVFVALAGGEVVGYAKLAFPPDETRAFHDLTGVKRAWRGRGIAGALKRAQIAWAKEHGYERLLTANEERNEPIRRLNERYGYRAGAGTIVLRTDLSDGA